MQGQGDHATRAPQACGGLLDGGSGHARTRRLHLHQVRDTPGHACGCVVRTLGRAVIQCPCRGWLCATMAGVGMLASTSGAVHTLFTPVAVCSFSCRGESVNERLAVMRAIDEACKAHAVHPQHCNSVLLCVIHLHLRCCLCPCRGEFVNERLAVMRVA
jgi:hypothetical protein